VTLLPASNFVYILEDENIPIFAKLTLSGTRETMAMFLIPLLFCSVKCCGTEAQPDNSMTIANMRVTGFDTRLILVFQFSLTNFIIVLSTTSCLGNQ
jgi:hypothetical protein